MFKLICRAFVAKVIVTGIIIFLFQVTDQKHFNTEQGPWKVAADKLQRCPPKLAGRNAIKFEPPVLRGGLNGQRKYFCGNMVVEYPISDSLSAELHPADQSSRGGWNSYPVQLRADNICQKAKVWVPNVFSRFLNSSDDIQPKNCPIREGIYRIEHLEMDVDGSDFTLIPVLPYIKLRADIVFYLPNNRSTNIGCLRLFLNIQPK